MVFSPMEYRYQRVVFLLLKQIVPLLRWITLPVVQVQIGRFLCKTYRIYFSKASVTLSVTGFIAIVSTSLLCFFFCTALFFCTAALLFAFSASEPDSFFINFYFLTALPFFLFSMFVMFIYVYGCFICFLFYTVLMFFSVCMF